MVTKPHQPSSATAYTNALVKTMFVATADQNYATARWAFLNRLYLDFFWLSLHAVEKYLKAILLYNNRTAKGYNHDIVKLHVAVLKLDLNLSFEDVSRPSVIPADLHWTDETADSFIKRMNDMGNPNNRYMLYGFVQRPDDLIKLDQLVWNIRRHCRPFKQTITARRTAEKTIDWVQALKKNIDQWYLSGDLLIERAAAGKTQEAIHDALFTLNFAFAPHADHRLEEWPFSGANPPLAAWFERLRDAQPGMNAKNTARDTLEWVLKNVPLNKNDKAILEEAINGKERS